MIHNAVQKIKFQKNLSLTTVLILSSTPQLCTWKNQKIHRIWSKRLAGFNNFAAPKTLEHIRMTKYMWRYDNTWSPNHQSKHPVVVKKKKKKANLMTLFNQFFYWAHDCHAITEDEILKLKKKQVKTLHFFQDNIYNKYIHI